MSSPSRFARLPLPPGYEWLAAGRWVAAVRSEFGAVLLQSGIDDPAALAAAGTRKFRGRGEPGRVVLADGTPGVLRRYLHGGAAGRLLGARFAGAVPRPVRELRATEQARAGGTRVPEVIAGLVRGGRSLHEGYLLTREVEGARDLLEVLSEPGPAGSLLAEVGAEARRMHDSGVWHADLHPKNVLVRDRDVFIIDFDRARIMDRVPEGLRERSLLRFDRSLVKLGLAGRRVSRPDRLRLLTGHEGERIPRDRLRGISARCRRRVFWHRLWWGAALRRRS